jgi:hypothetical protein
MRAVVLAILVFRQMLSTCRDTDALERGWVSNPAAVHDSDADPVLLQQRRKSGCGCNRSGGSVNMPRRASRIGLDATCDSCGTAPILPCRVGGLLQRARMLGLPDRADYILPVAQVNGRPCMSGHRGREALPLWQGSWVLGNIERWDHDRLAFESQDPPVARWCGQDRRRDHSFRADSATPAHQGVQLTAGGLHAQRLHLGL